MNKFWIGTAITHDYYRKWFPKFSESFKLLTNVKKFLIEIGSWPDESRTYEDTSVYKLEKFQLESAWRCLQYGEFLEAFDNPPERILLVDVDSKFQRDFKQDELDIFNNVQDGQVAIGYNAGPNDRAIQEHDRIRPLVEPSFLEDHFKFSLSDVKVRNFGFVCMTPKTWLSLKAEYLKHWKFIEPCFGYRSKNQFLMCLCLHILGLEIIDLDYNIHTNGFYPRTQYHETINNVLYYKGEKVLFAHKIFDTAVQR